MRARFQGLPVARPELVRHAGTILPHERPLDRVWGTENPRDSRYLKVFLNLLRRKLGDDAERPRHIQTVQGIGYRFLHPA